MVLAATFLLSGTLGIILAISLDNKLSLYWYQDILWWHVELGIAMSIVAFFHFLERIKYYLNILKK